MMMKVVAKGIFLFIDYNLLNVEFCLDTSMLSLWSNYFVDLNAVFCMLLDSHGEFSYVLIVLRLWSDLKFIGLLIVSTGINELDLVIITVIELHRRCLILLD